MYCQLTKHDNIMEKVLQIYQAIRVNSIVYEAGDLQAKINCDLVFGNKTVSTNLLISQTDVNRLIAKMSTSNHSEWLDNSMRSMYLEDGTQLIEYNFSDHLKGTVNNFHFNNSYIQIGA